MDARDIVKDLMKKKELPNAELARMLNITPATLWDRLNNRKGRKDIPLSLLTEMLDPLGYSVQIVPTETPVPDKGYRIGNTD